jgi:hypothetical protein
MKIDPNTFTPEQLIAYKVGKIHGAYGDVRCANHKYKQKLKIARQNLKSLMGNKPFKSNQYYHNGEWVTRPSTIEEALSELANVRSEYRSIVIPLDNHYKQLKQKFMENHPDYDGWL